MDGRRVWGRAALSGFFGGDGTQVMLPKEEKNAINGSATAIPISPQIDREFVMSDFRQGPITDRLELRALTEEDAAGLFALNSHPDVMKYTGEPPFRTLDEARSTFLTTAISMNSAMGVGAAYSKKIAR